jgi:site-specific recombinase XerD
MASGEFRVPGTSATAKLQPITAQVPEGGVNASGGLRHFAATSWLRGGAGLEEVRKLPGHECLNTTLRDGSHVGADLQRAHKKAGAIEPLRLD